jgi:hypothetical protein
MSGGSKETLLLSDKLAKRIPDGAHVATRRSILRPINPDFSREPIDLRMALPLLYGVQHKRWLNFNDENLMGERTMAELSRI